MLMVLCSIHPGGLRFVNSATGQAALVAEIMLAVKGNLPINKIINSWPPENYPDDWKAYRTNAYPSLQKDRD